MRVMLMTTWAALMAECLLKELVMYGCSTMWE